MVKRSRGRISRVSRRLGARARAIKPAEVVREFAIGARVVVVPNVRYRDFPAPRYAGRIGTVIGRRGDAWIVRVDNVKLIARAIHFKEVK